MQTDIIKRLHKGLAVTPDDYEWVAKVELTGQYYSTILAGYLNYLKALKGGGSSSADIKNARKVYLTMLGGGDFGNNYDWIAYAVYEAMKMFKEFVGRWETPFYELLVFSADPGLEIVVVHESYDQKSFFEVAYQNAEVYAKSSPPGADFAVCVFFLLFVVFVLNDVCPESRSSFLTIFADSRLSHKIAWLYIIKSKYQSFLF